MLRMKISVHKTKVMVVSSVVQTPRSFTCIGRDIEQVGAFRYLGLQVHSSGKIAHSIAPLRAKAASSWGLVQRRHAQLQCGVTVHIQLRLFHNILISTWNNYVQMLA